MKTLKYLILAYLLVPTVLFAQPPGPNDVFLRVVDSGAALCCVVRIR